MTTTNSITINNVGLEDFVRCVKQDTPEATVKSMSSWFKSHNHYNRKFHQRKTGGCDDIVQVVVPRAVVEALLIAIKVDEVADSQNHLIDGAIGVLLFERVQEYLGWSIQYDIATLLDVKCDMVKLSTGNAFELGPKWSDWVLLSNIKYAFTTYLLAQVGVRIEVVPDKFTEITKSMFVNEERWTEYKLSELEEILVRARGIIQNVNGVMKAIKN